METSEVASFFSSRIAFRRLQHQLQVQDASLRIGVEFGMAIALSVDIESDGFHIPAGHDFCFASDRIWNGHSAGKGSRVFWEILRELLQRIKRLRSRHDESRCFQTEIWDQCLFYFE